MVSDDDRCELNPDKVCDNCFQCLEPQEGQDYASIEIAAVYTNEDFSGGAADEASIDRADDDAAQTRVTTRPNIRASTLKGLKGSGACRKTATPPAA